jgi:glutathione S-transferase
MLFAAESGLNVEFKVVDLFTGEHLQPAYAAINPNCMVPVLEDGDFRLTEMFRPTNFRVRTFDRSHGPTPIPSQN